MPDTPRVSIVDPDHTGGRVDVLDDGEPREPRIPGRLKTAALVTVLLVAGGVMASRSGAEEVHLRGELGVVSGSWSGEESWNGAASTGVLSAEVVVSAVDGERGLDRITGVRLEGAGLTPRPASLTGQSAFPVTLWAESDLNCGKVAAGRYPESVDVVLDVMSRSGVTHSQRMPVPATALREAALVGCDLSDPGAPPQVEVQGVADGGADGVLLLVFPSGPRSRQLRVLEAVTVPGFEVRPARRLTLPTTLPSSSTHVQYFTVGVTDCALARGSAEVTVRLSDGDLEVQLVASTDSTAPQPDGMPIAELLQQLVDDAC